MRRAAAAALLLAAAPAGGAEFEVEVFKPSPAHPRIVLARRPGATATMVITFRAGSVEDENVPGLARVAQQAILGANARGSYEDLLTRLFAAGSQLDVDTGLRDATFTLTAERREFPRLAEQLAVMALAPRIDARLFPAAVERALHDEREPGRGATILAQLVSVSVTDSYYQNPPYGDSSLDGISQDMVEEHLAGPMSPGNAEVIVTGNFDRDRMLRFLRRFSGGAAQPRGRPRFDLPFNGQFAAGVETHILAYPAELKTPVQAGAARIAAAMLEDLLLRRFRGAGVGYSVLSQHFHADWLDLLLLVLPAHDPSETDLAPLFRAAVEEVSSGAVPPATFEQNRDHVWNRLRRIDRDSRLLAGELRGGAPSWYGPAVAEAVRTMSKETFASTVAPWLAPESSIYVLFSPKVARKAPARPAGRRSR